MTKPKENAMGDGEWKTALTVPEIIAAVRCDMGGGDIK